MSYPSAVIVLDGSERRLVEHVAQERSAAALRLGRTPILGERDLAADVLGAAGEYGLARFTRFFWHAVRDDLIDLPDVGTSFESKAIGERRLSLLIPRGKLRRDRVYFLVLVESPRVEVLGAVAGDAITESDLNERLRLGPAYQVRQQDPRFLRGVALQRFRARDERRHAV